MSHILAVATGFGIALGIGYFLIEGKIAQCELTHPKCEYVGMAVPVEVE